MSHRKPVLLRRPPSVQLAAVTGEPYDDYYDEGGGEETDREPVVRTKVWRHPDVIIEKAVLALFAFAIFWDIFAVTWMWIYRAIPSVPPNILSLGGIYFIPFYFIVVINFFMLFQRKAKIWRWVWWLELVAFLLSVWMACIALYEIISCWDNTLPAICRETQFSQFLLILLTLALFVFMTVSFICFTSIVSRLKYVQ